MEEKITLTKNQLRLQAVMIRLINRLITNKQASKELGITIRQVQRKKVAYIEKGVESLIHGSTGKKTGRGYSDETRKRIIDLYEKEYKGWNFSHFNHTIAREHDIHVSDPYVYRLLTEVGYISPKHKKHQKQKVHPPRERRENAGELLQTDASIHDWFGIGVDIALHGMIDDATNAVTGLVFAEQETNLGYQLTLRETIEHYGIPVELYTDYRGTFQNNHKLTLEEELAGKRLKETHYMAMCRKLGIGITSTREATAKGRIERLWQTLQDRLVKELAKANVKTIEEANQYIKAIFLPQFNAEFASPIDCNRNLFVPVDNEFDYERRLALEDVRKVHNGCVILAYAVSITLSSKTTRMRALVHVYQ